MPSLRAKVFHKITKLMWSSKRKKPLTKERLLAGRPNTHKFGRLFRTWQPVKTTTTKVDGITVDIVMPRNEKWNKIILYLHGGGFVYGLSSAHYEMANRLAVQANAKVFVVHYSLAPEHKFPIQINEVKKVYVWLLKQGYKSKEIFFVGDSAGGHLAISSTLLIRDKKLPLPGGIIAMSSGLDLTFSYMSFIKNEASDFAISPQIIHFFRDAYLGDEPPTNPLASPTFANLKGLPKIQLFVGDGELLFDDVVIFSKKLKKAGVPYELHIGKSLIHAYPLAGWLFPEAKEAINHMARFINED